MEDLWASKYRELVVEDILDADPKNQFDGRI